MTFTVKLHPELEGRLREQAKATGRTASEVVRAALQAYLASQEALQRPSAYALGEDLFGRHAGPVDLAAQRKQALAEVWEERHDSRAP